MEENILHRELFGLLETSKSLIVFDDIWKEEDWDRIKPIFPDTAGWKVLLTSRRESVARRGDKTYINFKPECLSDKDSWTLFQRIEMPRKDASEWNKVNKEMEEMGKQMIKHCKGLPLAVRVLGGSLAAKYTLRDWKRISENIGSHLLGRTNFDDDYNNSFYHVLSLSFEELPGYLKYCFLYLAHFPEDYKIGVKNLSYFWAAEGIVWNKDGETIRDVGDSYIEELVKRNMVISERDNTTSRFETCCLHDLMREICLSKSKEENFVQIVGIGSSTAITQSLCTSRRFVSHSPITLCYRRAINNSKVRSFVDLKSRLPWNYPSISFKRLQLLRVLHLPGGTFKGGKVPYIIGKLIHLRYLYLEEAWVFHIPSSLRNLKLLIYLNLNVDGGVTSMPNILIGMKELRYLALPAYLSKKRKLRLSHLVNLETLINPSTDNCSLEDLRGMSKLRTLGIRITGESSLETLSALIGGLRHLEDLDIDYEEAKGTKEWRTLLDFNNLKQLTLNIRGPLLCDQLQFPSRLTSLMLEWCHLEEDPMPILEKLGQLKEVNIRSGSFCGRRMVYSRGGFPQLQKLILFVLDELEEWIVEEGSMPLLHTLQINCCRKLLVFPDGLEFITSLKNLSVYCMGEQWEERLSKGGEDYYKVQHIPSVRFNDL